MMPSFLVSSVTHTLPLQVPPNPVCAALPEWGRHFNGILNAGPPYLAGPPSRTREIGPALRKAWAFLEIHPDPGEEDAGAGITEAQVEPGLREEAQV